jgi:hypothetical protein
LTCDRAMFIVCAFFLPLSAPSVVVSERVRLPSTDDVDGYGFARLAEGGEAEADDRS